MLDCLRFWTTLNRMASLFRPRFSVVVPVFNAIQHLRACLESIRAAIRRYGNAELIVIDNGSTDGSYELLCADYASDAKIEQDKEATVAGLRNLGARVAGGDYLSFIDADCVIDEDYFERAASILASLDTAAVGSMYDLPPHPRWIEETWYLLHRLPKDSYVNFLNSGNFIIARDVFDRIGGFDESLITGEDAEICLRLRATGHNIYHAREVRAMHLGNPKTLWGFVRKQVWQGLGMFGTAKLKWLDKPLLLTFGHLFLTAAGIANLFVAWTNLLWRVAVLAVTVALAPAAAFIYRSAQTGKFQRPLQSMFLYWLFLNSWVYALLLIVTGRAGKAARLR
jgi:glycosyltransferase involved in cell wall biosynthesis